MSKRYSVITISILSLCLLFLFIQFNQLLLLFNQVEQRFIDYRFQLKQPHYYEDPIIIVDIDTSSLKRLSKWPWPRSYYATIIERLNQYGAKAIGFDILFDNESMSSKDDALFSSSLSSYKNITLASRYINQKHTHFELKTWSFPIDSLKKHSQTGFVNHPFESDGVIRKSFGMIPYKSSHYQYSFDALTLLSYLNLTEKDILANSSSHTLQIGSKTYSLNNKNEFYINFSNNDTFTRIPFYLVLENRVPDPSIFKDKIVLIGASDPSLNDLFFTPKGRIPGVEIHAHSISTLMHQNALKPFNQLLTLMIWLVLFFYIAKISLKYSSKTGFFMMFTILTTYSLFTLFCFNSLNLIILWSPFLIIGFFIYFGINIYRLIHEEKEKQYIKSVFKQYVAPEVVTTLLENPNQLHLGGEKRHLTVFFSDIRSFTTLSEMHPPELIVAQLNEYFDVMTQSIMTHKGTLDKFIGDEIMAIWGAPLSLDNHAELALRSAWDQLQKLKQLQNNWEKKGYPLFDIGIGINTGDAIVGNIGSTYHKDYTVIGDSVNVAARLQSMTRTFSTNDHTCRLVISETTYQHVKTICKVIDLGTTAMRGKKIKSTIYEVIDVFEQD